MSTMMVAARAMTNELPGRTTERLARIAAVGETLATGRPGRIVGQLGGGVNGRMDVHEIVGDGASVRAMTKSVRQGGVHEVFAYESAAAMGIEHLLPVTVRGRGGDAVIEVVDARTWSDLRLMRTEDLEDAIRKVHEARGMSRGDAAHAARVDRQLMQVFDVVIGNRDRHSRNGMIPAGRAVADAAEGQVVLIDHGKLASFSKGLPRINSQYGLGPDTARLDPIRGQKVRVLTLLPEVRAAVAATDRPRIVRALERAIADTPRDGRMGDNPVIPDARWMRHIDETLDDAATRGSIRYMWAPAPAP